MPKFAGALIFVWWCVVEFALQWWRSHNEPQLYGDLPSVFMFVVLSIPATAISVILFGGICFGLYCLWSTLVGNGGERV